VKRVADYIAEAMEKDGIECICWGDGLLVDVGRDHLKLRNMHPLNVTKAACDALENAPDRFEKFMMRGHDARARPRLVRAFRLKQQTPQPN
jgi:hypothetical protein